jgi:cell division protease FtsH
VFLGYSMGKQQNISESTAQTIDAEVRRLVEMGLSEARRIITEKRDDLEAVAQGLLEYETLSGDEILGLIAGKAPVRESDNDTPTPRSSPVPTAGKGRPRTEPGAGGLEPQPQA